MCPDIHIVESAEYRKEENHEHIYGQPGNN